MSFSSDVRAETAREVVMDPCCARAEFAGALLACGGVSFHGAGRYSLALTATDAVVIRHFFSLLKHFFNISCQIRTLRTNQLRGATRYQLAVPDEAAGCLMDACGLLDPEALFGVRAIPKADHPIIPAAEKGLFARRVSALRRGQQSGEVLSPGICRTQRNFGRFRYRIDGIF